MLVNSCRNFVSGNTPQSFLESFLFLTVSVVIGLETFQEISRKFFGNCVSGNRARNCVSGYVEPKKGHKIEKNPEEGEKKSDV